MKCKMSLSLVLVACVLVTIALCMVVSRCDCCSSLRSHESFYDSSYASTSSPTPSVNQMCYYPGDPEKKMYAMPCKPLKTQSSTSTCALPDNRKITINGSCSDIDPIVIDTSNIPCYDKLVASKMRTPNNYYYITDSNNKEYTKQTEAFNCIKANCPNIDFDSHMGPCPDRPNEEQVVSKMQTIDDSWTGSCDTLIQHFGGCR